MVHISLLFAGIVLFIAGCATVFRRGPILNFRYWTADKQEKQKMRKDSAQQKEQTMIFLLLGGALFLFGLAGVTKNDSYYSYSTLLAMAVCGLLLFSRVQMKIVQHKRVR